MTIKQSIEEARAERLGEAGASRAELDAALARCAPALDWFRRQHADGALALLRYPAKRDDIGAITRAAERLSKGASDVVFLGAGGSSLGGQTLAQLAGYGIPGLGMFRNEPRVHFMDNLDPETLSGLLSRLPLETTRFVAISKSGATAETLMQTAAVLAALEGNGLSARAPEFLTAISEPETPGKRNPLRALLGPFKVPFLDHDPGVGGRFSVLTNVGLLPAAVLGLDIEAIRAGAAVSLASVLDGRAPEDVPAACGAALAIALAAKGKSLSVLMAYADRLERFTKWYVQRWAESLGKAGRGTTPLAALGPVDQHSQLQLFIAGPRDKLFTVITTGTAGRGPRINPELAARMGEDALGGKTVGDLVAAQGRATVETLAKNGCPVRTIHVERIDEHSLGELLMHFMLETIIAARLLDIDPFDQPAVEEGKVLAKRYLTGQA